MINFHFFSFWRLLFLLPPVTVAAEGGSLSVSTSVETTAKTYSGAPVTGRVQYIDPRIGSEGLGRVFIGPSCPFGMVKPSPDCTESPNSGWLPMPEQVNGFAQVHVSGTGGGPKYGNILVMPYSTAANPTAPVAHREWETILPGYYATAFCENGIQTEITTAERASFYRFTYPADSLKSLVIDAGFYLGRQPIPDGREAQQFVGSEVQLLSDHEVCGYSRIRGGWNNGRAYTVYFYAETDVPFTEAATFKDGRIRPERAQYDSGQPTGALLHFPTSARQVQLKIGISFLSCLKARQNAREGIPHWSFSETHRRTLQQWEDLLGRIEIAADTPAAQQRMFYTGLYHTMLMPVDRSGENPLWTDPEPYYDDFYAIWDTYRTSTPLITLIDPQRESDIVRSLINIYKRDGYMPDARSGNCNGRTQGGSNAEIVIADAFVKGLTGIDYELGLEAMLKDATVPPGGNEEAEGRGGLLPYRELGYIPYGIPRAGNRTIEYAFCDYAIATVAKGLGKEDLYRQYLQQSGNWKNLWRKDYEHEGVKGFILPRDGQGKWLDQVPYGHSDLQRPTFTYTPVTFEGPWYTPWWNMFFYEASSWEYSLSIPHDVPGLIEQCGGPQAFDARLDTFFDKGFFNVNNEPSFLSPCLYHWIGRPDKSSDRVLSIIGRHYNDGPVGLPGNDDSGAMSSWLAFHMTGLYPNAGHDYYLIHTPVLTATTFHLAGGKDFTIRTEGLSAKNRYIQSATLNGKEYPCSTLRHSDLMAGGTLVLKMGSQPGNWGKTLFNH
ncbi:MAG: GH92 family glycosyl hydrolase [Phocaeicola plebeius]